MVEASPFYGISPDVSAGHQLPCGSGNLPIGQSAWRLVGHEEEDVFTERDAQIGEKGLAGQAAIAMDNARLTSYPRMKRAKAEAANRAKGPAAGDDLARVADTAKRDHRMVAYASARPV